MFLRQAQDEMSKVTIRVPACSGHMVVTQIHAKAGARVAEGEVVMALFSTSQVLEVKAPKTGRIVPVVSQGDEVAEEEQLAILTPDPDLVSEEDELDLAAFRVSDGPGIGDRDLGAGRGAMFQADLTPPAMAPPLPTAPAPMVGDHAPSGESRATALVPYDAYLADVEGRMRAMRPSLAERRMEEKVARGWALARFGASVFAFVAAAGVLLPQAHDMVQTAPVDLRAAFLASAVGFGALVWMIFGLTGSRLARRSVGRASMAWSLAAALFLFGGEDFSAAKLWGEGGLGEQLASLATVAQPAQAAAIPALAAQPAAPIAAKQEQRPLAPVVKASTGPAAAEIGAPFSDRPFVLTGHKQDGHSVKMRVNASGALALQSRQPSLRPVAQVATKGVSAQPEAPMIARRDAASLKAPVLLSARDTLPKDGSTNFRMPMPKPRPRTA
ncbi:MAG: biotin/lipoyl-containing protein [Pseudomonadota bacterium]